MLTAYRLRRFLCSTCGTFERGQPVTQKPQYRCPICQATDVELVNDIPGYTSRALPFHSKPCSRSERENPSYMGPGTTWERKTNRQSSANGKSTGRPRKINSGAS